MITAIPVKDEQISNHFSKAQSLVFVDGLGKQIGHCDNLGAEDNCAGKQQLVDLIVAHRAERVLVRNIGQRMLGKLLACELEVHQLGSARADWSELTNLVSKQLTEATQGRPSHKFEAKGGKCCHGEGEPTQHDGKCCEGGEHQAKALLSKAGRRCCHS